MKKLLSLLATATLVSSSATAVVACNPDGTSGGTDSLPDANFTLDSDSVVIDTKNIGTIKVTNYDVLNDKSKPTKFTYSTEGLVEITTGLNGELNVNPRTSVQSELTVKIASEIYETEIKVVVNEIVPEKQMTLDVTDLSLKTNRMGYIKITNWDALVTEAKPISFEVNSTYASATLDSPNQRIIVSANSTAISNIQILIKDSSGFTAAVKLTITIEVIDLDAENTFVSNIIAGNMVDNVIDPTIAIGADGFTITDESVIKAFNVMNSLNLSANDVNVVRTGDGTSEGNNGIGASYYLTAKTGSTSVKGSHLLTLNQNIDPIAYFANKNLGEIRLFSGAYNQLETVLTSTDKISLAAIIFEQVGGRNPQLEYLKSNFIQNFGAAGQAIMKNAVTTATTFQITNMPSLNGVFKENVDVQFTYKFVEEDRITLFEALPTSGKVKVDVDNLSDKSKYGQADAKTQIYNQLSTAFKEVITLSHFIEYTNIIFGSVITEIVTDEDGEEAQIEKAIDFKFDVLPGSDKLYGHDGAAFMGYICSGALGSMTGGGDLNKYETGGTLAEKYTTGMGVITGAGLVTGNFWQGHDIMVLNQSLKTAMADQTITSGVDTDLTFDLENMASGYIVTVDSDNSDIVATLTDNGSYNYSLKLSTSASSGDTATIKIKVNGFTSQSFTVTVA